MPAASENNPFAYFVEDRRCRKTRSSGGQSGSTGFSRWAGLKSVELWRKGGGMNSRNRLLTFL